MDTGRLASTCATIEALAAQPLDVLVIGAGSTGAGIAATAASRGLRTALIDRDDIAGCGHSGSNPLIPIGLQFPHPTSLQQLFETSRQGHRLQQRAPHLVRPARFVVPVFRKAKVPPQRLAGVVAIDAALSGFRNVCHHRLLGKRTLLEREPLLRDRGLMGGVVFSDMVLDKARLTIATARAAAQRGAMVRTYTEATGFSISDGRIRGVDLRDRRSGDVIRVSVQAVVNAAGAHVEAVRAFEASSAPPLRPLYRAAQLVVLTSRLGARQPLRIESPLDGAWLFVLPLGDRTVLGTVCQAVGTPGLVDLSDTDIAYLLRSVNALFPNAHLTEEHILDRRSTVKMAPADQGEEQADIVVGPAGLITAGSAFPFGDRVADTVVEHIVSRGAVPNVPAGDDVVVLPGGDARDFDPLRQPGAELGLAESVIDRLISRYGTEAAAVFNLVRDDQAQDLRAPLDPAHPAIAAEVVHCVRREFATTVEDMLSRRLHVRQDLEDRGRGVAGRVAALMGAELGWDEERVRAEATTYRDGVPG